MIINKIKLLKELEDTKEKQENKEKWFELLWFSIPFIFLLIVFFNFIIISIEGEIIK